MVRGGCQPRSVEFNGRQNMNNSQSIRDELKTSLDILYDNRSQEIESAKTLSEMNNDQAKKLIAAYDKIRTTHQDSIGTEYHDILIDIIGSYPEKTFDSGTFGEFMFGCIDVDIIDMRQSCRRQCENGIVSNQHRYKKTSLPTWKYSNGSMKKINEGRPDATRGLLFIDNINSFNTNLIPTEIDTIEVYTNQDDPSESFIGTYRNGELVKPNISSLTTNPTRASPVRNVSFRQTEPVKIESESVIDSVDTNLTESIEEPSIPAATSSTQSNSSTIRRWVGLAVILLAAGLIFYLIYRYFKNQSNTVSMSSRRTFQQI